MNSIAHLAQPMILIKEHEPIVLEHDDPITAPRDERNVIGNGRFENARYEFERLVPWGTLYDRPLKHVALHEYNSGFAALIPAEVTLFQSVNPEPFETAMTFRISFKAKASIEFESEEGRHTDIRWQFNFQTNTHGYGDVFVHNRPCGNKWTEFSLDFRRQNNGPIIYSWFFIGVRPNEVPHPTDPKGVWVTDISVIALD